jgi:hypothetical protein
LPCTLCAVSACSKSHADTCQICPVNIITNSTGSSSCDCLSGFETEKNVKKGLSYVPMILNFTEPEISELYVIKLEKTISEGIKLDAIVLEKNAIEEEEELEILFKRNEKLFGEDVIRDKETRDDERIGGTINNIGDSKRILGNTTASNV